MNLDKINSVLSQDDIKKLRNTIFVNKLKGMAVNNALLAAVETKIKELETEKQAVIETIEKHIQAFVK